MPGDERDEIGSPDDGRGQAKPPRLQDAPLGTLAPAIDGGAWLLVERGWQWNGHRPHPGSTFPRPGGDWNGRLIPPKDEP